MKQWKLLKPISKKVVAVVYEMWSFTKGSSCCNWHMEVRLYCLSFLTHMYILFVCFVFEGEILALEAKLKELNEKEAEFTDAIKQQEGKIESVKMEFAPQQNALDKRQGEIEEREKTIQQEYVSNETPILGVYWAAVR